MFFCIRYLFLNVQFLVNQSTLMHGIAKKKKKEFEPEKNKQVER